EHERPRSARHVSITATPLDHCGGTPTTPASSVTSVTPIPVRMRESVHIGTTARRAKLAFAPCGRRILASRSQDRLAAGQAVSTADLRLGEAAPVLLGLRQDRRDQARRTVLVERDADEVGGGHRRGRADLGPRPGHHAYAE